MVNRIGSLNRIIRYRIKGLDMIPSSCPYKAHREVLYNLG